MGRQQKEKQQQQRKSTTPPSSTITIDIIIDYIIDCFHNNNKG